MWWIIFGIWLLLGLVINICMSAEKSIPEKKKKCGWSVTTWVFVGIAALGLAILILYGLGCLWYFFCSGFLVFEADSFWDKILYGFISLLMFGGLLGFIAILFGWKPDGR